MLHRRCGLPNLVRGSWVTPSHLEWRGMISPVLGRTPVRRWATWPFWGSSRPRSRERSIGPDISIVFNFGYGIQKLLRYRMSAGHLSFDGYECEIYLKNTCTNQFRNRSTWISCQPSGAQNAFFAQACRNGSCTLVNLFAALFPANVRIRTGATSTPGFGDSTPTRSDSALKSSPKSSGTSRR